MKLKEYIFKLIAATMFISAGFTYVIMCGTDNNAIILETKRNGDEMSGSVDNNGISDNNSISISKSYNEIYTESSKSVISEGNNIESNDEINDQNENDKRININTADQVMLTGLPGIGPAKADAIIAYREENGEFLSVEELMRVPGIKEGTFGKVKDLICVK